MRSKLRILNGYRVILRPDHPKRMTGRAWGDYIYEHIVVAEEMIGREIREKEVVHHLNGDRGDNRTDNLLVLERGQHNKLHSWISKGASGIEIMTDCVERIKEHKDIPSPPCLVCKKIVTKGNDKYCSPKCFGLGNRKVTRPSKVTLEEEMKKLPMTKIGKKYGVSDTAVKKWARTYNLIE